MQLALIVPGLRLPRASALILLKKRKNRSAAQELTLSDLVPTPNQRQRWLSPHTPELTVSPHLVDPAQAMLFDARRDWSRFTVGSVARLPSLTPAAQALLEEFQRHADTEHRQGQITPLEFALQVSLSTALFGGLKLAL